MLASSREESSKRRKEWAAVGGEWVLCALVPLLQQAVQVLPLQSFELLNSGDSRRQKEEKKKERCFLYGEA